MNILREIVKARIVKEWTKIPGIKQTKIVVAGYNAKRRIDVRAIGWGPANVTGSAIKLGNPHITY